MSKGESSSFIKEAKKYQKKFKLLLEIGVIEDAWRTQLSSRKDSYNQFPYDLLDASITPTGIEGLLNTLSLVSALMFTVVAV